MTTHALTAQSAAVTIRRILEAVQRFAGIGYDRDHSTWGIYRGTSSIVSGCVLGLRLGRLYGYVGYLNDSDEALSAALLASDASDVAHELAAA